MSDRVQFAGQPPSEVDNLWAMVREEMTAYRQSREAPRPDCERLRWHAAEVESLALHIRVLGNHGLADTCECYARRIRADVVKYGAG